MEISEIKPPITLPEGTNYQDLNEAHLSGVDSQDRTEEELYSTPQAIADNLSHFKDSIENSQDLPELQKATQAFTALNKDGKSEFDTYGGGNPEEKDELRSLKDDVLENLLAIESLNDPNSESSTKKNAVDKANNLAFSETITPSQTRLIETVMDRIVAGDPGIRLDRVLSNAKYVIENYPGRQTSAIFEQKLIEVIQSPNVPTYNRTDCLKFSNEQSGELEDQATEILISALSPTTEEVSDDERRFNVSARTIAVEKAKNLMYSETTTPSQTRLIETLFNRIVAGDPDIRANAIISDAKYIIENFPARQTSAILLRRIKEISEKNTNAGNLTKEAMAKLSTTF